MKQALLFFILITKCALAASMIAPAEHIKKRIKHLQDEGATKEDLYHIATLTLLELLECSLLQESAENYLTIYKTLVDVGGNRNVQHRKNGKTALMFAVLDSRPDIVQGLLGLGVDATIRDRSGHTALQQFPVINEATIPEIKNLLEEALIAHTIPKNKIV